MREGQGRPPSGGEDREKDSLLERLRVYESFDEVISESMHRARGFLQDAAEMREKVMRELADARQELEEELAEARAKLREEIAEAREEIEEERQELVSIARTILQRSGSSSKSTGQESAPIAEPEPVTPYPLDQQPAHEAEQEAALIPAPVTSQTPPPAAGDATPPPVAEAAQEPGAPQTPEEPNPTPGETPDVTVAEAPEPSPVRDPEPVPPVIPEPAPAAPTAEPGTVRTTIIVHGISKPAVATGLQRYLLAQPGVTAVEPREFAEGILRLQVHASTPVDDALFAGWGDGAGMTVIQRVPRTVEVILPSAT